MNRILTSQPARTKAHRFTLSRLLSLILLFSFFSGSLLGCSAVSLPETSVSDPIQSEFSESEDSSQGTLTSSSSEALPEDGQYSSKDEVALYLHLYGHLPDNYITKQEAQDLGWNSKEGNLWDVAYGKSIGGDKFGNYEKLLPTASGRKYYECDIDYDGGFRGPYRIIYSNDGLIYYTEDHYESFDLLYEGDKP